MMKPLAVLAAVAMTGAALAQEGDFPSKPIRIIVAVAAGGRLLGERQRLPLHGGIESGVGRLRYSHSMINGTGKPLSARDVLSVTIITAVRFTVNFVRSPKIAFSICRNVSKRIDDSKRARFRVDGDLTGSYRRTWLLHCVRFCIYNGLSIAQDFGSSLPENLSFAWNQM